MQGPTRQRGFPSGAANPMVIRQQQRLEKQAAAKRRVRRRTEERRAAADMASPASAAAGPKTSLTHYQRCTILKQAAGGKSYQDIADCVGVSKATVGREVKAHGAAGNSVPAAGTADAGSTPQPKERVRQSAGGRPTEYTPTKVAAVGQAADKDPFGAIAHLQEALRAQGHHFEERALYRMLTKARATKKAANNYAAWTPSLVHGVYNWIEALEADINAENITWANLAYMDQTPVHITAAHQGGRSTQLIFGECGDQKGAKKIGSLWAVITQFGCLRLWFTKDNGDDITCKDFFFSESTPTNFWVNLYGEEGNIFDLLKAHGDKHKALLGRRKQMILVLDRLGKSGSSHYSVSGHHRPEIRAEALKRGVGLALLCPKGAECNPVELFNCAVKRILKRLQPPGGGDDGFGQVQRGPRTEEEALAMLRDVLAAMTAPQYRYFFHARALGSDARKRFNRSTVAAAVREERERDPRKPYSFVREAFARRAWNSAPADFYPASFTVAETYNVYYYRYLRLNAAYGLPPPFQRPLAKDGKEKECRLCSLHSKLSANYDRNLIICLTCTGVYHRECVEFGVANPPPLNNSWRCPFCVRKISPQARVWKKPKTTGDGAGAKGGKAAEGRGRKRARSSDGESSEDSESEDD